jgi:hypothetical protein
MPPTTRNTTTESDEWARAHQLVAEAFAEGKANEELRRTDPEAYKRKMEAELPVKKCCFCGDTFRGYGNNPWPVRPYHTDTGVACDDCNDTIVVPQRVREAERAGQ